MVVRKDDLARLATEITQLKQTMPTVLALKTTEKNSRVLALEKGRTVMVFI